VLMVRQTGLVGSFMVGHLYVPTAQICSHLTKKCVLASDWLKVI